ncbi:MAG: hypothetical protein JXJ04_18495 [Spirochaetales bacterium]|nr:hypothetical protein [Spirochaetales bacterium]
MSTWIQTDDNYKRKGYIDIDDWMYQGILYVVQEYFTGHSGLWKASSYLMLKAGVAIALYHSCPFLSRLFTLLHLKNKNTMELLLTPPEDRSALIA